MQTVNIGIVAHVDAGKTSLTERLLFDTGVIDRLGSVDAGTTQTDTGELERRRGITIRSAVAAFRVGERQVNLIDTPGHSDFVAEVERALAVLDGAILVLSAVEGVQPHTRLLMRTLRGLRLPTLIFVNKIDRAGARGPELVADIRRRLSRHAVPLGTVTAIGTRAAEFRGFGEADPAGTALLADVLADLDDSLLADLVDGIAPEGARLSAGLRAQTAAGRAHPVLFGSALSGAGIPALLDAVAVLLPPAPAAENRLRGKVFAIERGPDGKVAYVRSYGGEVRPRQRLTIHRRAPDGSIVAVPGRVSGVEVVGDPEPGAALTAGRIGRIRGLPDARIGDQLGSPDGLADGSRFPRPGLETQVRAARAEQTPALHAALVGLADQDPLIDVRVGPDGELSLLLYGEVQREVIAATLAETYAVVAEFAPTQVVYRERPVGVGSAYEPFGAGFAAGLGLRVTPGPTGSGLAYRLEVELGSLPLAFHRAIEETVGHALDQGRYGWSVTDLVVTVTHCAYSSPVTVAGDFRDLTPLVLAGALAAAGTRVFEPCHRFEVDVPPHRLGPVTARLAQVGARIDRTDRSADDSWQIVGEIPARLSYAFQQRLPDLAGGEGTWSARPGGDRPVSGTPPHRPRTDGNPFDRAEYTRFLARPPR